MTFTVWLSGLPCSGKTSIAKEIAKQTGAFHLDGDILRRHICSDLGFSKEDREENLRRASSIAKMLNEGGFNVVASFITPYQSVRDSIRKRVEETSNFIMVYVKCGLKTCMCRDTKGMYEKAMKGEIKEFTGISSPYEPPERADITVFTKTYSVQESANKILIYLQASNMVK